MKARVVVIGLVCAVGAVVILSSTVVRGSEQQRPGAVVTMPASLEKLYPPQSPAPQYLLSMHELSKPFSGIVCDVLEGDMENAKMNFERFRTAYAATAAMVPEWTDQYPNEPIEQLGAAVASGDPTKIMPAIEMTGAVCHGCHVNMMVPVQQKYRWDKFSDIALTDPLSGQKVSYAQLMLMMETNFGGIANDLAQGQTENAVRQFEGFSARFQEFADACMICHESERRYFVSPDVTEKIAALGNALAQPQIDMAGVGGLMQAIGQESCGKCHLVHLPAAYAQQTVMAH